MPHSFFVAVSRQKKQSKSLISCLMFITAFYANTVQAFADQPSHLIKSAMIFKMLQYTHWPNETQLSTLRVAFVGDDNKLYQEMLNAAKTIQVRGKPVIVFKTDLNLIDPQSNQVVYLSASHEKSLHQLANAFRRTDTLLISNKAQDRHNMMINFLNIADKSQRFEVNRANMLIEKLFIDKELLLLGGTEIDVAELFRESEQALQQIKLELSKREQQLKTTNQELTAEQRQIQRQKAQIKQYRLDTAKQVEQRTLRIAELNKLNADVNKASQQLQNKQTELAEREQRNKEQLRRFDDQSMKVAFLNQQIVEKQAAVLEKEKELDQLFDRMGHQAGLMANQQRTLIIALVILFVFSGLILFTLWVNRSRKRSNQELKQSRANLVTLGGIGRKLTTSLDLNKVIEQVYQSLNEELDAHIFLLGILETDKNRIHVPLMVEEKQKAKPTAFDLDDDNRPAVWCIKNRKELVINTTEQWFDYFDKPQPKPIIGEQMTTVVYLPLIIGDKVVGCLSLQSPEPNAYTQEQLDMIRTLSSYTAIALVNALGYTELEQQKRTTEQRNREIMAAQQQLIQSEKMASLGMLTTGVAHEINDPANFTHTATYMMQDEIGKMK